MCWEFVIPMLIGVRIFISRCRIISCSVFSLDSTKVCCCFIVYGSRHNILYIICSTTKSNKCLLLKTEQNIVCRMYYVNPNEKIYYGLYSLTPETIEYIMYSIVRRPDSIDTIEVSPKLTCKTWPWNLSHR